MALALTFDRAAATAVASHDADGDEALQRKLWLAIARHLICATGSAADPDPVRPHLPALQQLALALVGCPLVVFWLT